MVIRRGTIVSVDDSLVEVGIGPDLCLACQVSRCRARPTTVRARCSEPCNPGDVVEISTDVRSTVRGLLRVFLYPVVTAVVLYPFHWGAALVGAAIVVAAAIVAGRRDESVPRVTSVMSAVSPPSR